MTRLESEQCGFGLDPSMLNPNDTAIDGPRRFYIRKGEDVILGCKVSSCRVKDIATKLDRTVIGDSAEAVREIVREESISNPSGGLYKAIAQAKLSCPRFKISVSKTG
jgi:hypothetical protein